MAGRAVPITLRAQALALLEVNTSIAKITEQTGLVKSTIYRIKKIAYERGFDPAKDSAFKDEFFEDAPRSGRPKVILAETTATVLKEIKESREGREKTSRELGYSAGISEMSTLRILHANKIGKWKPTWKPGLTQVMRDARYKFALEHENWLLEDWKNVIWSDETSIILGHRRGATRVWRTKEERFDETVIRRRWKKASEFMFWGCFSYDKKGPMHIWAPETAQEKRAAAKELEIVNALRKPTLKAEWKVNTAMRRVNLQR